MPGVVGAAELAQLRADAALVVCDQTCVITRKIAGVWTTVVTTIAGKSTPSERALAQYAYLLGTLVTWRIAVPTGTDIQRQDRILIAGETMTVQVMLTAPSYSTLDTVLATELV